MNLTHIGKEIVMEGSGWKVFREVDGKLLSSDRDFSYVRGRVNFFHSGPGFHLFKTRTEAYKYIKENCGGYCKSDSPRLFDEDCHGQGNCSRGRSCTAYNDRGRNDICKEQILQSKVIRVGFSSYVCAETSWRCGQVILAQQIYVPTQEEMAIFSSDKLVREKVGCV